MLQDLETAKIAVRKSAVQEEIVRELDLQSDLRPTELWERIEDRIDTSKKNFYQNLSALTGHIIDRVEGGRRMALYSLTGQEQLQRFAYESNLFEGGLE